MFTIAILRPTPPRAKCLLLASGSMPKNAKLPSSLCCSIILIIIFSYYFVVPVSFRYSGKKQSREPTFASVDANVRFVVENERPADAP